jgi:replicative DNA helicase
LGELPLFLAPEAENLEWIFGFCSAFKVRASEKEIPELGLLVLDCATAQGGPPKGIARMVGEANSLEQLRMTAGKYGFVTLLTAPVDRGVENRRDHRPTLADLRNTPDLAQVSDVIYGLYRDEIYDPYSLDRCLAELLVLKSIQRLQRSLRLVFEPSIPCFYDLAHVRAALRGGCRAISDW